ncbi:MAG TPA: hypothetical protein VKA44_00690 [Gemmatimonadota bacterium]|nr:hypothetical protein [Gemmatimonadota bacterium]
MRPGTAPAGAAGPAGGSRRHAIVAALALLPALLLALAALPAPARAQQQYGFALPRGDTLSFSLDTLRRWMDEVRRFRDILERDPHVLYYTGTGPAASASDPGPAYPWNAVRVRSDSVAEVATPSNLREMDRAYTNYAVLEMSSLRREGPTSSCEQVVSRETDRASSFVDGWILSRTLYGGPPFPPIDALAFARASGHLTAMLVALRDSELAGCADKWEKGHPERMGAYRAWRRGALGAEPGPAAADSAGPADSTGASADSTGMSADSTGTSPDSASAATGGG